MTEQPEGGLASRGRVSPWLHVFLAIAVVVAGGYLIRLAMPFRGMPTVTLGALGVVTVALIAIGLLVAIRRASQRGRSAWLRASVYLVAGAFIGLGVQRSIAWRRAALDRLPDPEAITTARLEELTPVERAEWAARVMAHLVTRPVADGGSQAIPETWPFPIGVVVAIEFNDVATYVWTRTAEDSIGCIAVPVHSAPLDSALGCGARRRSAQALDYTPPIRIAESIASVPRAPQSPGWTQYRQNALRSGTDARRMRDSAIGGWRATTDGPIRASVSVIDDRVVVGGHGTGSLTVFDLATGTLSWRTRAPNWIHQDPVSDGRIVVTGFGDSRGSFEGTAPSGVAAYELSTGRHLWTRFDESSVMTSAIVADSTVVYATGIGVLRKRRLRDGSLLDSARLPGRVVMAPMALVGDTLVATLDADGVCALELSSLSTIWCRRFPHLRMMGHASPAVSSGQVVLSGLTTLFALTPDDVRQFGWGRRRRLLAGIFEPRTGKEIIAGQLFMGLDLATGETRWITPNFPYQHGMVPGHIAGTAVLSSDTLGVIVLPGGNVMVGFNPATGAVRWSHPSHHARGSALVVDDRVVLAGRDGIVEVRRLLGGELVCTIKRETGWDRAGPVYAAGLVIFADLDGVIEATPWSDLRNCRAPGATPAPSAS